MTLRGRCVVVAALITGCASAALAGPRVTQEIVRENRMVAVELDGNTVELEVRIYRPDADGPRPTLVFHHGSTGNGRDPERFTQVWEFTALVEYFVGRGWAVVMPSRRGRGGSEGLYDEGFAADRREGYTCDPTVSLPGADRALRDIEAATAAILEMPFVDPNHVVVGGQSRGGILSVAYAGAHRQQVRGVINFVGGWLGAGCPTSAFVNRNLFVRGATYERPMIWLYGHNDPYYPIDHSKASFASFEDAGGQARFVEFAAGEGEGHFIVSVADAWAGVMDEYLERALAEE